MTTPTLKPAKRLQFALRYESDRNPSDLQTTRSRCAYLLRAARSRSHNYGSMIVRRGAHHYEIMDGQEPRGLSMFPAK